MFALPAAQSSEVRTAPIVVEDLRLARFVKFATVLSFFASTLACPFAPSTSMSDHLVVIIGLLVGQVCLHVEGGNLKLDFGFFLGLLSLHGHKLLYHVLLYELLLDLVIETPFVVAGSCIPIFNMFP